jgi:hypothetical protein
MISKPHFQGLDTAFLQLSFAMQLLHHIAHDRIPRALFNSDLTVIGSNGVPFVTRKFQTDNDVTLAAENNVSISFGTVAITLWEAIREHSGLDNSTITPAASPREMLAGLAYAIRCCFAHGTVEPRWRLTPKYRIEYQLGSLGIDLRAVDGQPFEYHQVGGFDVLITLRAHATSAGLL